LLREKIPDIPKDFLGSLKRALDHIAEKKKPSTEIEKFKKLDEMTQEYLKWKGAI
jgi:hypothetical protein